MLIVAKGKVVIGRRIIELGEELNGLTPEAEAELIASGVAARVGDAGADEAPEKQPAGKEPTKPELQARCRELGLNPNGNKDELKARIADAELEDGEVDDDDEPPTLSAEVPQ